MQKYKGLIDKCNQYASIMEDFLSNFSNFVDIMSIENEMFKYFNNYCEMVEFLLNSIKTYRIGDFELHLLTTRQMLPYLFAVNNTNYK